LLLLALQSRHQADSRNLLLFSLLLRGPQNCRVLAAAGLCCCCILAAVTNFFALREV
jgi:hypothetical protein